MPDYYYFFFSYARGNHENARWERQGTCGNYLDEFFEALCRQVSDRTGRPAKEVAYRDQTRLKVSEFWDQGLVEGLQKSRVLISLISPRYLESVNCGREMMFFNKRLEQYCRLHEVGVTAHRIMPVFWANSEHCFKNVSPGTNNFLKRCNLTQAGMPGNYPAVGLSQICQLRPDTDYEKLCHALADRIVELADNNDPLPKLSDDEDFHALESLYAYLERETTEDVVLHGPSGANVFYVVGTRAEMEVAGALPADDYRDNREGWFPFPEAPGATVEMLTREGANVIGLNDLRNLKLSEKLVPLIETAKRRNSPVLLVLDRRALSLKEIKQRMKEYDKVNFDHCGLVTAGGAGVPDGDVEEVFQFKHKDLYHVWNVPASRAGYVESVTSVLRGIKEQLMRQGTPETTFTRSTMPGLSAPTEN